MLTLTLTHIFAVLSVLALAILQTKAQEKGGLYGGAGQALCDDKAWTPPASERDSTCKCKAEGIYGDLSSNCTSGQICLYNGKCDWPRCPQYDPNGGIDVYQNAICETSTTGNKLVSTFFTDDACTSKFNIPANSPQKNLPNSYNAGQCISAKSMGLGDSPFDAIIPSCDKNKGTYTIKLFSDSSCSKKFEGLPEIQKKLGCTKYGSSSDFAPKPRHKCPGTDGKIAFNGADAACSCGLMACPRGTACLLEKTLFGDSPQCVSIFVGERNSKKCPIYSDQKCACSYSDSLQCKIGQGCVYSNVQSQSICIAASTLPDSADCKKPELNYQLEQTISFTGFSADAFNSRNNMINAFRAAVAKTIGIDESRIPLHFIKATPIRGSDDSNSGSGSSSSADAGRRLDNRALHRSLTFRRRLGESCGVSYTVLCSHEELKSFKTKISTNLSCATDCGYNFMTRFKAYMASEKVVGIDVDNIVADTSAAPVEKKTRKKIPSDDSNSNEDENKGMMSPGLIAAIVIIPTIVIIAVGIFLWRKRSRKGLESAPEYEIMNDKTNMGALT